ncbi:zinc finger transcription factor YY1 isoform X2 [Magnolia sinica]|uniref:zinc finger transcription factor YY1 isoform X2 n=1 Tax=Magnolia sinica TaxID=86752 RepID=UPI0026591CAB|nr:zinc finger transcription factor YY1 isoform X2 [Magnolia sinica]
MELQTNHHIFERRPIVKDKTPAVRWFKEWVPQEVVSTGGKCYLLKWVTEDMLKALKEKHKEPEPEEPEPEPTTEVLFLCSYEGCGKTFIDAGALRKHSHIHGEKQHVCQHAGCGRKFLDSSKLKRHNLIHTGERHFVCPHEGCGKAFSLDFNLRAHMRTHSQENYHICPYEDCGKRYAHEYKLKTHIKAHHEKNVTNDVMKQAPPAEKLHSTPKAPAVVYGSASSDRPYACPYEGCGKSYIHEYKLNLHLRREHPGHNAEENGKQAPEIDNNDMDEGSDQDAYTGKGSNGKNLKRSKPKLISKVVPPSKMAKGSSLPVVTANVTMQKQWPAKDMCEEDSEETEEDCENVKEDGWRYAENNEDDEETEYED